MKHLGLTSRVRRLERKGKANRPRPAVIYKLCDEPDDSVTGIGDITAPLCERRWGETFDSLISRAKSLAQPRTPLLCIYPTPTPETALCDDPGAMPEPAPPVAVFDPKRQDAWRDYRTFVEQGQKP